MLGFGLSYWRAPRIGTRLIQPGALGSALSFSRASAAWVREGGTRTSYAINAPRFSAAGRFITEGARTNVFLNSTAPVTQSITVTAQVYTVSFYGTGSITLSGTSTGTLSGVGADTLVQLSFTPTAGTLTLTVAGSVTDAQLEAGNPASSRIVTAGASVTRSADVSSCAFSTLFPNGVGTVLASFMIPVATGNVAAFPFEISDGTSSNRILVQNPASGVSLQLRRVTGGASQTGTLGSYTAGTLFRVGMIFDGATITGNFNGGSNAALATQPAGLSTLRIGNNVTLNAPMFGEAGYFDTLPYAIPATSLPAAVLGLP